MPPSLIFGGGGIGEGAISHTWTDAASTRQLLSDLHGLGIDRIDSAASYPPGSPWTTERLLGEADASEGFTIDSKILVTRETLRGSLEKAKVAASVERSFELLKVKKLNVLHIHAFDPATPVEETARAFDELYRLGRFEKFGLCNCTKAQLEQYLTVCEDKGYIKPSVYQGNYNALGRHCEESQVPLLRKHGMVFNAYGPLAGGFLTGKVSTPKPDADLSRSSRWAKDNFTLYPAAYMKEELHDAVRAFKEMCEEHGTTTTEASLRWLTYHSVLGDGDGIILGATRVDQLRGNVEACRKGRLPNEVLKAVEQLWENAKDHVGVIGA